MTKWKLALADAVGFAAYSQRGPPGDSRPLRLKRFNILPIRNAAGNKERASYPLAIRCDQSRILWCCVDRLASDPPATRPRSVSRRADRSSREDRSARLET